jgi:superfamily II DNA or RNA helicase
VAINLEITLKNNSFLFVDCDPGVSAELNDYFAFFAPGHKYQPLFKKKLWDGKIRLWNRMTQELNTGLYLKLKDFCMNRGYTMTLRDSDEYGLPNAKNPINHIETMKYIKSLNLPWEIRDYQYDAVAYGITHKKAVLQSPTGSGKSLIIYTLLRWYLDNHDQNILIVVPTTSLVEQMFNDFKEYGFDSDNDCHIIYSGKDKDTNKRVTISTWQSIYKLKPEWFRQFGCVFGDECHGFKAKSLSSIMNKCTEADYRFGTTGTLDGTQVNRLVLTGLFGPVKKVITTKDLQENKTLAELNINIIAFNYSKAERERFWSTTSNYQEELDFIVTHGTRNKFICNLASSLDGNTLVLFQFVEKHGKVLFDMIDTKIDGKKKVFYVSGETETSDREVIRHIIDKQKNSVVVASLGTFSTGINIRNLHNIIFASPSKSQIRVLQSIGRGLRQSDDGRATTLYDLADDLHIKSKKNFTLEHSAERIKIYNNEQFNHKVYKVDIE